VTGVIPITSEGTEHADRPEFAWLPVAIILALMAIGVTSMLLAKRRRRAREEGRKAVEEAIVDVLGDTLDDLRRERDPRRAVIAAYARLERTLAEHGFPRGSAETQTEYVARILHELDVDRAAVRRLTDLFSRAKFSQHAVDIPMKDEAIDALEHVRDELREAAAREEAPESELVTSGASL
jgi:shikimate 5-dehydrogenase